MIIDPQPHLSDASIRLRPLLSEDFGAVYHAAKDPEIWAGHPAPNRWQEAQFRPYFDMLLISCATLVIEEVGSGAVIGTSRYYTVPEPKDALSIGYTFLIRAHWGGKTNAQVKRLMLNHAFATVDEVWFHIGPNNIRSQKATARFGAVYRFNTVLNLSGTPAEVMCFQLRSTDYLELFGG